MQELALMGGDKAVKENHADIFKWPVITREDEEAVLDVLRRGAMSGTDVTMEFEKEFSRWQGSTHALGFSSGTAAIQSAMYGCGIGVGDEIISPSLTYWASCLQAFSLGATVVFAEADPDTLCLDPDDIEHRITDRTKAIVAVHYLGHPCDMDRIMDIAKKHGLKVIEDVSHAQGGLYRGEKLGSIGDAGAMSLMSGKSFATGEAGMLVTDNTEIYERAIAFGHYQRFKAEGIQTEYLKPLEGLPMGGYKYRMHQLSSALGRVQLKHYDRRCAEIRNAMNYFWDLLEDVPGLKAHRTHPDSNSNMAGWYSAKGLYCPEELEGLSVSRFTEAVKAEGFGSSPGCNKPLHTHPLFNEHDVYGHGKPTRIAFSDRDLRQPAGSLPVTEGLMERTYNIPWFKKYEPKVIEEYALAFRKAAENYRELLDGDEGNPSSLGSWSLFVRE